MTWIFVFYLLATPPADKVLCALWVSQPPGRAQMLEACGVPGFGDPDLVWRAVDIYSGQVACERPANELPAIEKCILSPLHRYRLVVVRPQHQELLCTLHIQHDGEPTRAEIADQCGALQGEYELRLVQSFGVAPPTPAPPVCQMPPLGGLLPASPADLWTETEYKILAYQLRWNYATAISAIDWQNQWDESIYRAGEQYRVPPAALKSLFAVEAQFWPLYNGPDEIGMGQLTDDGADLVLRYSPALFARHCRIAGLSCQSYALLSPADRQRVRDVLRGSLRTGGTPRMAAAQVHDQMSTWAQILAAWYCHAGEMLSGWGDRPAALRWDLTLAAYHAGGECIRSGVVCPAGDEYLRRIGR